MSFLDSLENNLKALESREERDPREGERRQEERQRALAEAPWAEKLKGSAFTETLLLKATQAGHRLRAKVYIAWLGNTLRLEMKERKLDLRPTAGGVVAVFSTNGVEEPPQPVHLDADPGALLDAWLK